MILGGVDGCKGGWIIIYKQNDVLQYKVISKFSDIDTLNLNKLQLFVDTPIGLSAQLKKRTVESAMRKELKGRASTVFNAPARLTLRATSYQEASKLNFEVEGKKLSQQSYHIIPKIKEVDDYLVMKPEDVIIYESHPELCFKHLNNGQVLYSKKSDVINGIAERLSILNKYEPAAIALYHQIEKETRKKFVKRDDIVDALCLFVSNQFFVKNGPQFISDENELDERDIPIKIAYGRPN